MKTNLDTLIFDLDGVLVDSEPDIVNAANFTRRSLGLVELPPQTIISYIGGGGEVLMRRCLAEKADDLIGQALPLFIQRYEEYCCVDTRLYDGVKTVLEHYQAAGKRLAIATQKNEAITASILKGLKIASFFEIVLGLESVTHRKPHPESILHILNRTGTAATRAVMVGDMGTDILAGKAAGTFTCGVLYGYGKISEIQAVQPDFTINNLTEMLDWID
jgi:phosphoglycolate phosphatase